MNNACISFTEWIEQYAIKSLLGDKTKCILIKMWFLSMLEVIANF